MQEHIGRYHISHPGPGCFQHPAKIVQDPFGLGLDVAACKFASLVGSEIPGNVNKLPRLDCRAEGKVEIGADPDNLLA